MAKEKFKIVKCGPITERRNYSNTKHELEIQDLLQMQKDSFEWLLKKGLEEIFNEIYPIKSNNEKIIVDYIKKSVKIVKPKNEYSAIQEAKQKGSTYSAKIFVKLRKTIVETGEIKEDEILFGELPLMTSSASFIVNGSEKIIVPQLIRSAGAYYGLSVRNKQTDDLFNKLEFIPKIGAWIEIFHRVTGHSIDTVKVKINKQKSILLTTFLRALGLEKESIESLFGNSKVLQETLKREKTKNQYDSIEAIYQIIRKGDRVTKESVNALLPNLFFNPRRYNLSKTDRYVLNNKLKVSNRIIDTILAEDLIASETNEEYVSGQVIFKKGHKFTAKDAQLVDKLFKDKVLKLTSIPDIKPELVYGKVLNDNPKLKTKIKVAMVKVYSNEQKYQKDEEPTLVIGNNQNDDDLVLLVSDIIASISYYFNLIEGIGIDDDPDSLINKRIILIGELLQNQFKIALTKVERNTKERMASKEIDKITLKNVTNNKPVYNQFKSFFNSSRLSQFMDQINPLSEISNKRRITSLGPGGLNRETAQFEVRDVHPTHYGRICPIETPEGPNIGLILNLAVYARINEYGFLETPYFRVNNGVVDYSKPVYLVASEEYGFTFAQSTVTVDEKNRITNPTVTVRKNHDFLIVKKEEVDFIDVSSRQITSIAASAIPFLENDDANRALMGSNMQRQAVSLLEAEAPIVGTGIEGSIASFSAGNLKAKKEGQVVFVDSTKIKIKSEGSDEIIVYNLRQFEKSNQGTLIHQKPIVKLGDVVKKDDILTDGSSFKDGEMALGKNLLVAFSTWNGYNFEDAIIINERLVKDDVLTSIHIEEQTIQFRTSKTGNDILTKEVPNASTTSKRFLDENGIVVVGSEVSAGDILVGRASPKGEYNPTPEEKLMAVIFGSARDANLQDTSLKVKHGQAGTVIKVEILSRDQGDILEDGIDKIVKVFIAQKRKIKVGDKLAGRHGNKGVISVILPEEDMPYLEDGTPVDICLNPQGVPSRMNLGQILELHLGYAGKKLGVKFACPSFDGVKIENIQSILKEANLPVSGKQKLFNPINGEVVDNDVAVGVMYMLKLSHMVDDKMHARSVGPYSLITQQPLGGKSQNGGQRFGEMETWAIEAHGATNILQELLTYKSDNISGRNKLYNALVTGSPLPTAGTPESFNVLAYELRGLSIKLEVHEKSEDKKVVTPGGRK
ncbi:MAG: DNA-directed RNA polymerase subunit beta [Mycoplasmataceae bacterium]|nr:DNA-directed RNA polymerase subunit beta [Mycoplasmataceae bacterium]